MTKIEVKKAEVKPEYPLIERLEKKFSEYPKLRLSGFLKKNIKGVSLKDFLDLFFKQYNHEYNTRFIDDNYDDETTDTMRSIQDIYSICKYYYPTCTLKDVFQSLFELCSENKIFGKWYCHTINKYVFSDKYTAYDRFTVRKDSFMERVRISTYDVFKELGFKQSDFINKNYNNTKKDADYNQTED